MEKLIVKGYSDFDTIISKLKENRKLEIDLTELDNKLIVRILDLITGYVYERGNIEKVKSGKFIVSLAK